MTYEEFKSLKVGDLVKLKDGIEEFQGQYTNGKFYHVLHIGESNWVETIDDTGSVNGLHYVHFELVKEIK